jgi:hypothetical protein
MYYAGRGTTQDYAQAFKWFSKAAAQGSATAQCNLGLLYLKGQGVAADSALARAWLEKSASLGNGSAKEQLAALERPTPASVQSTANGSESIRQLAPAAAPDHRDGGGYSPGAALAQ